jgi:hypothetical protein
MGNHFRKGGDQHTSDSRKQVCILYNGSDELQKKNAKSFRDALRAGDGGKNMVIKFIDVSKELFDGLEWLRQIKHVVVVCVNEQSTESLRQVIDKEGIKNGGPEKTMHAKVLSVSFGTTPPQEIMEDVLQRPRITVDMKRDFCFGFESLDKIVAGDFDSSTVMKELRTTIISAMSEN